MIYETRHSSRPDLRRLTRFPFGKLAADDRRADEIARETATAFRQSVSARIAISGIHIFASHSGFPDPIFKLQLLTDRL